MDRDVLRKNLSFILLIMFIWSLLSVLFVIDNIGNISTSRDRDPNKANEDTLFIFWENGSTVGIGIDLRIVVLVTGVLFFISIFSNLTIFHYFGDNENE